MELYDISPVAYGYYRAKVKGNENVSYNEAQRKLTRNIELSVRVPVEDDVIIYLYGNLHIHTKGNLIVKIVNHWSKNDWFYSNDKLKQELSKKYGVRYLRPEERSNIDYMEQYAQYAKECIENPD